MTLDEITKGMQERVEGAPVIGATVKFDFGDDGVIFIEGAESPMSVSNNDKDADCTITVSKDDFKDIVNGETNAQMAFMMGKLRVDGDMGVAMKLSDILG